MGYTHTGPADRSRGTIRKLFGTDMPLFREHLLRLDPQSRRDRFVGAVSDAYLAAYAERCFASEGLVYGYVEDGRVRGAAELQPYGEWSDLRAEAAFSVEAPWRCQGIGSALFEHLLVAARNRRVRQLAMSCLAYNRPMQALARKYRADLALERGEVVGTVATAGPTPFTLMQEAVDDARGFMSAAADLQQRIWQPLGAAPAATPATQTAR
ncbi:GNAT family N-acetyltransferase [Chelatococcus sp. SYSU_G07232]|uniref:GNAT family N-acetyltransferase n=1 Tax=Chelatococcus albus TaxID=3047466 RepID=A0ABT7AD94_9HYPH|nr:GNAT family N-acetyltransferase [Chelatococcus sp. SYSU_G07232]MDJ1157351.1 GNAT family N-acetyltransferase [Chelatococcus sp. SYSU_G07232]